ncbi:hypothetical protein D7V97_07895 [Corallococcus sp. CA053C]|uniref:hypothetical protein n=1 Tax=Corallococcus sp. CA053C TaxID=2316732 RepID=UPI000EA398F8|nr:hypothetical protein [Corallococcus sp. CA053C]RKH12639.1 hypothetical protein D7V97_07895 [Corallococcus sp. CA053C]
MRHVSVWVACALLTACASGPRRSTRGDLRLDTETVGSVRHAALVAERAVASRAVASTLVQSVPALLAMMQTHEAAGELEERLAECAVRAERRGNALFFHDRPPTRAECGEVVEQDACGKPVTRAMQLGRRKHVLALECAREVLEALWPAPFSIEQRYRYYPNAKVVETMSREKEARLIAEDCTEELWGTIKPDLVLHADRNLLKAALILDFKFPCPEDNPPRWTKYGGSSPYANQSQRDVYQTALGGRALLISPVKGVLPP